MIYYNKNGIIVRTSTELDVAMMKQRLRKSDIQEIWASHYCSPKTALILSYRTSEVCLTIDMKGMPVAMFGIAPQTLLSNSATVWMLASDGIKKIRKSFVKECRGFIDMLLERYSVLENWVDARNTLSICWLKWCGAQIEEAKPYGIKNLPFHHFIFRRQICA